MTVTARQPLTCECGSTAWTLGTEAVARDKDGYSVSRICRRCLKPGPNQYVSYMGRSRWSIDPEMKTAPNPVAGTVPETTTQPDVPAKESTVSEAERIKAPSIHTATSILHERLANLIPRVVEVTEAKKEAEQVHAALIALGEQPQPLPWKRTKL